MQFFRPNWKTAKYHLYLNIMAQLIQALSKDE